MRLGAWALLLAVGAGCGGVVAPSTTDGGASVDASSTPTADRPDATRVIDHCPVGWAKLPDGNCVPPALACAPDAGAADPTCMPIGLRSAALTPWVCPSGWRYDADRGCLPTIRTDCPEGTGPLPDGSCTNTGVATCPDAPYAAVPEGADPSRVVHVDDDAPPGGDGSRERPLRELGPVLENDRAGTTVLLAAGRYPVRAEVRREVRVIGVCAPQVTLVPRDDATAPELILAMNVDARLTFEGLSFRTVRHRAVAAIGGASVTLRGVIAHADRNALVLAVESSANISEVVWSASEPLRGEQWAVVQARGGRVNVRRVSVSGAAARVAHLSANAVGTIEDVAAVGVEGGTTVDSAEGRIEVSRMFVSGGSAHGVWHAYAQGTYRDIALDDSSIRVSWGATATMERVSVRRGGFQVFEPATSLQVTDLAMLEVVQRPDLIGSCIALDKGAHISVRRGRFTHCDGTAAYAALGASMDLEDALFREVRPNPVGFLGVGVSQALGGASTLRRVIVDHAGAAGIAAIHLSPTLARGIPWEMWAPPAIARALREPSRLTVQDVVIREGESAPQMPGAGVFVGAHSEVVGERIAVIRQRGVGLLAGDSGYERQAVAESLGGEARQLLGFLPPFIDGPSAMRIRDVYVGPVTRARILFDTTTRRSQPDFLAGYAAYVSPRSVMSITGAYIIGNAVTESALVSQGALSVDGGLVMGTTRCAGLRSAATEGTVSLTSVRMIENGRDEVCVDDTIPALRLPMSPN